MKFSRLLLSEAAGAILGHNVSGPDGRRLLRKGRSLSPEDLETLGSLGRTTVFAARLDPDDVDENNAAERITRAVVATDGLRLTGPATGRVNFRATRRGIVRVDTKRLLELNRIDGVTLATLPSHSAVQEGRTVGTTKILPYAVPEASVAAAEAIGRDRPVLRLDPLQSFRAALVVTGSGGTRKATLDGFETALRRRLETLGSTLELTRFVETDGSGEADAPERLAKVLVELRDQGAELLLLAGETAIQDRHDLAPSAIELAGGEITSFGAPVDPGNLLLLAYLDETPVVGAPGCARSPKSNIVDLVLPRLLAGDRLTHEDIIVLGHGGLLEDVPERPLPRSRV